MGLFILLEDEFRANEVVRVRPLAPTRIQRSPDLPQDYDPQSSALHQIRGVRVLTMKREYFFPVEWFQEKSRFKIETQVQDIYDQLEREK